MSQPIVTQGGRGPGRGRRALVALLIVLFPLLIAGALWVLFTGGGMTVPSNADMVGSPVRVPTADGDRVIMMTSQWKSYRSRAISSGTSYTGLLVDVWGFDANDAKPLWRTRIVDDRRAQNLGRKILGAHGGIVWLLDGEGLVGLSPRDGSRVADAAALEAANPALKGMVPTEERYYRFDPQGLSFRAADGRDWRLTGQGAATAPDGPKLTTDEERAPAKPGVFIPARVAGGTGSWAFYARGVNTGKMWLGLMAPGELQGVRETGAIGGTVDTESYPRTSLWSARVVERYGLFGSAVAIKDPKPLPESPEFINAGLLQDGRCCSDRPILLSKPDSVLVLHKDRLGEGSRFRLTRVSGPLGKPLWSAELPATALDAVMPGERSTVIAGRRDEPPLYGRDRRPESVDQLMAVDNATGRVSVYGFRIRGTEAKDIPKSSTAAGDAR